MKIETIVKSPYILFSKLKIAKFQVFNYPPLNLAETDYDSYWKDKRKDNMGSIYKMQKERADWILPRIEENSTVLDIGSGDGAVLFYLLGNKKFKAIAADISNYTLNFLKQNNIEIIKFDINNFEQVKFLPKVDYIILFEVLEHMQNPERFIKELEKKVKKSIFFSFPNSGYYIYRLRVIFGRSVMQWRLHPGEHLRFWTYKDLKWWLKELGYENNSEVHIYDGIPLLNKLFKGLFGKAIVGELRINEK